MSHPHRATLLAAIRNKDYRGLWSLCQRLTEDEVVLAATAIGPQRLRALLLRHAARPAAGEPAGTLAAVLAVAYQDRRFLGAANSGAQLSRIRASLTRVRRRRAAAPQLMPGQDLTHTLAEPAECKAPLNDENFKDVAKRHNIAVAAIKAVAQVESGGRSGFDDSNRPKILFEAHHFRKHTKGRFDLSHPHLSCERAGAKKYYAWDQYQRLFEAMVLAPVAAIQSASWGKFQILGSNHNGWTDAVSFAQAMQASEANHLKSFEAYCVQNGLMRHLRDKAWGKFAEGYNGKNYKDFDYDTKIERAYKAYGGT
jgi:hypothetical protein